MTYRLTKHAIERLTQFSLTVPQVLHALEFSEKYWLTRGEKRFKLRKWGEDQMDISYRIYDTLLFTLKRKQYPDGSFYSLVLTVTDLRVNARS